MINAGCNGSRLTVVAPEGDHLNMIWVLSSEILQHSQTGIRTAIVHKDDLPFGVDGIQGRMDGIMEIHQILFFVINGNYQG
jgi:hypothetical protein